MSQLELNREISRVTGESINTLITISRLFAKEIRSVFRRALQITASHTNQIVWLLADETGLRVRAQNHHAIAEHHQPGKVAPDSIPVTMESLAAAKVPRPMNLSASSSAPMERSFCVGRIGSSRSRSKSMRRRCVPIAEIGLRRAAQLASTASVRIVLVSLR